MADPEQFTSLFIKHERQLYAYIAAMLGQPAEAEDLLQETSKALWNKFDDYDPSLPFMPWAVSGLGDVSVLYRTELLHLFTRKASCRGSTRKLPTGRSGLA